MPADPLVVVGDRWERFLRNPDTVAASELLASLLAGDPPRGPVVAGLGLTAEQRDELVALLGPALAAPPPAPAGRRLTHKHDPANVMVSAPVREGEGRFALDLVVDAGTETMQDHITGQHVPAIALLEAARQAWTAVTEEHLLTNGDGATRFVIVSVHAEFGRYVFPLPARLRYELIDHRRDALGEAFRCRIAVVQGGAEATVVEAEYRVVPETISDKQESMAARRALTEVDVRPASPVPATNG